MVKAIDSTVLGKKSINYIISIRYDIINRATVDFSTGGFSSPERCIIWDMINNIKREVDMLLENDEAYYIYMAVKNTEKIKGDIAEVGVYQGGSAKIICAANNEKSLHLFDTFEGIPSLDAIDSVNFHEGQFACPLDVVKNYLSQYEKIFFYKGTFPDTSVPVIDKKFSFVHLDVDTYPSTLNCLKFFYPRMSQGGIIISHDYLVAGVRKAFDEFFVDKPDPIIELLSSQCLIVKTSR